MSLSSFSDARAKPSKFPCLPDRCLCPCPLDATAEPSRPSYVCRTRCIRSDAFLATPSTTGSGALLLLQIDIHVLKTRGYSRLRKLGPTPNKVFKKIPIQRGFFPFLKDLRLWLVFLGEGFLEVFLVGQLQLFPVLEEVLRLHL